MFRRGRLATVPLRVADSALPGRAPPGRLGTRGLNFRDPPPALIGCIRRPLLGPGGVVAAGVWGLAAVAAAAAGPPSRRGRLTEAGDDSCGGVPTVAKGLTSGRAGKARRKEEPGDLSVTRAALPPPPLLLP